jgi:hypothetical protein
MKERKKKERKEKDKRERGKRQREKKERDKREREKSEREREKKDKQKERKENEKIETERKGLRMSTFYRRIGLNAMDKITTVRMTFVHTLEPILVAYVVRFENKKNSST